MTKDTNIVNLIGWLSKSYQLILLVVLAGIVIHAPLTVFLGGVVWPEFSEIIKAWKEVLLLFASGLAVILVTNAKMWPSLLKDWLIRLSILYALLHVLILFIFDTGALPAAAGLMIDLRFILYFVLVYVAMRLNPGFKRPFLIAFGAGALLVVGFALLQVLVFPADILRHIGYGAGTIQPYITIDQNPDYVRINSTLRGPNPLGAYAAIVLAVVAAAIAYRRMPASWLWRSLVAILLIGSLVAVWFSYSRSALIGAIAALLFILITTTVKKVGWKVPAFVFGLLVIITSSALFAFRDSSFVTNVILHENPESSSESKSNNEHLESLILGTDRMINQPFGAGVGSTGSASLYGDKGLIIENQFLFIAHETGWVGLILFLAIFGIITWRLWLKRDDFLALGLLASGIGLTMIGMLLPVWADDTVSMVWWGLAGAVMGGYAVKGRELKGETNDRSLE